VETDRKVAFRILDLLDAVLRDPQLVRGAGFQSAGGPFIAPV